jgi:hypothetical protein
VKIPLYVSSNGGRIPKKTNPTVARLSLAVASSQRSLLYTIR